MGRGQAVRQWVLVPLFGGEVENPNKKQQKQASLKLQEEKFVMRENSMLMPNATLTTTFVLPHPPHAKENAIVGAVD
ncbi:hypothetical protein Fmac_017890 [Flemingia macrophylla]|uniref:Uncharacterized protein n=1 Tax=Flemingia macrophylla TaxID=520843 RepID=A0ABD1M3F0_9FABA